MVHEIGQQSVQIRMRNKGIMDKTQENINM